ncbi:MAG: hypothetical protein IJ617_03570 [Oscillospiraceae bacterium]|nr:hypothetical protein [Oscillospiraceae bacterium]
MSAPDKRRRTPPEGSLRERFPYYLAYFGLCLLIVGLGLAIIGLYYVLGRAGSAAPDAALEQQIAYLANRYVGETLFWYGLIAAAGGIMSFLCSRLAKR